MRLTEYRRTWDKEGSGQVLQLGIRHGEIPTIILTRKEWRSLPKGEKNDNA
ncbi:MAG: hypothetical protein WAK17_16755 [Candidatus Nitrosopolaris sp.]